MKYLARGVTGSSQGGRYAQPCSRKRVAKAQCSATPAVSALSSIIIAGLWSGARVAGGLETRRLLFRQRDEIEVSEELCELYGLDPESFPATYADFLDLDGRLLPAPLGGLLLLVYTVAAVALVAPVVGEHRVRRAVRTPTDRVRRRHP